MDTPQPIRSQRQQLEDGCIAEIYALIKSIENCNPVYIWYMLACQASVMEVDIKSKELGITKMTLYLSRRYDDRVGLNFKYNDDSWNTKFFMLSLAKDLRGICELDLLPYLMSVPEDFMQDNENMLNFTSFYRSDAWGPIWTF